MLAGYISEAQTWADFNECWDAELNEPPRLEYFKRREAFHRDGQFAQFGSEEDIQARVNKFVELTRRHVMVRVACWVKRSEYDYYLKDQPVPMGNVEGDPYFALFYKLILSVVTFQRQWRWDTKVEFAFDVHGAIGTYARSWYPMFCELANRFPCHPSFPHLRDYLPPEPKFEDDKEFYPLQAADLYAWNFRREKLENRMLWVPASQEFKTLCEAQEITRELNCAEIQELRAQLLAVRSTSLTPDPSC